MTRRLALAPLALVVAGTALASSAPSRPGVGTAGVAAGERAAAADDLIGTRMTVHAVTPVAATGDQAVLHLLVQGDNERVLRGFGLAPRRERSAAGEELVGLELPLFEALKSYKGYIVRYELLARDRETGRKLAAAGTTDLDCTVVQVEPGLAGGARIVCVVDAVVDR